MCRRLVPCGFSVYHAQVGLEPRKLYNVIDFMIHDIDKLVRHMAVFARSPRVSPELHIRHGCIDRTLARTSSPGDNSPGRGREDAPQPIWQGVGRGKGKWCATIFAMWTRGFHIRLARARRAAFPGAVGGQSQWSDARHRLIVGP